MRQPLQIERDETATHADKAVEYLRGVADSMGQYAAPLQHTDALLAFAQVHATLAVAEQLSAIR